MKNTLNSNENTLTPIATPLIFALKPADIRPSEEDRQVYEKFYRANFHRVYRYLWRQLGRNRETAEDIAQEAFTRTLERAPMLKQHSLKSYVFDIAESLLEEHQHTLHHLALS